jgi:hypothetical protein
VARAVHWFGFDPRSRSSPPQPAMRQARRWNGFGFFYCEFYGRIGGISCLLSVYFHQQTSSGPVGVARLMLFGSLIQFVWC